MENNPEYGIAYCIVDDIRRYGDNGDVCSQGCAGSDASDAR